MVALAADLTELLAKFGGQMAERVNAAMPAISDGTLSPADTAELRKMEANRSRGSGKPFAFYPAQRTQIAGQIAAVRTGNKLVADCATGKTPVAVAIAQLVHKRAAAYHVVVICPAHLVLKWEREIKWLLPDSHTNIIRNLSDLVAWHRTCPDKGAAFAVLSKETAKLGFQLNAPACATRWTRVTDGDNKHRRIQVAACPACGTIQVRPDGTVWDADSYRAAKAPVRCSKCGDNLATHRRHPTVAVGKRPHLDTYIQRKMRGFFDLCIADEAHELAAATSAQGRAFGVIAAAAKRSLDLTGTLIGGKADDLHAPMWRVAPDLMRKRGFDLGAFKNGRMSPIARNAKGFVRLYGVIETKQIRGLDDDYRGRIRHGALSRREQYGKSTERIRPGISPDLFCHFLPGRATFMSLSELGPELPTLERILVPCTMSETLRAAYKKLDDDLTSAMHDRMGGKAPPTLAATRIGALDAYVDRPWGWDPITCKVYDKDGCEWKTEEVAWPADLGTNYLDSKDEELKRICLEEKKLGRRCAVYIQYTQKHDVRGKIAAMLEEAGLTVAALPDSVKAIDRERWIALNGEHADVLIVHPKRVMTGLDLIAFPSLVFYQVGYSTHVLRQASARARRPSQTKPCKVFYLFYTGTVQAGAMALMGEKEKASLTLEGTFDLQGLQALMNGGEDDDILVALSQSVGGKDPLAAWKAVQEAESAPAATVDCPLFALAESLSLFDLEA